MKSIFEKIKNLFNRNPAKYKRVPETLHDDDEVSRFIVQKRYIRQDKSVRHNAFLPFIPNGKQIPELSLFYTNGLEQDEVWSDLSKIPKKTPIGRGILTVNVFLQNQLEIISTPSAHPLHIDAVGWSMKKEEQLLIAKKLSMNAVLEENPQ